jgi:methylated-DNA-[protein]-cysteine S-methyltransferase
MNITTYTCRFDTPLGQMSAAAGGQALTGLWFLGQKYFPDTSAWTEQPELPVFKELKLWLDDYFAGKNPVCTFSLAPQGSSFRQEVWKALLEIPYGQLSSYGELGRKVARMRNTANTGDEAAFKPVPARAIGGAVGHNPISIIIPCHRIVGADGSLTGYAGGLERKKALLELESSIASPSVLPLTGPAR